MYLCAMCVQRPWRLEDGVASLGLELQTFVNCLVVLLTAEQLLQHLVCVFLSAKYNIFLKVCEICRKMVGPRKHNIK